jgi:hypothetical protein
MKFVEILFTSTKSQGSFSQLLLRATFKHLRLKAELSAIEPAQEEL